MSKLDPRNGLIKIIDSAKGVMSLIILSVSAVLCGMGRVDGTSFAAIVSVVSTVFLASHAMVNSAAIKASAQAITASVAVKPVPDIKPPPP